LYSLTSHGIPKLMLPINEEGVVEVERYRNWLAELQQSENTTFPRTASTRTGVSRDLVMPTDKDVLLGRGRLIEGNPGNLVASYFGEYQKASRFEKADVLDDAYDRIKESGSRFLKMEDGDWIEAEGAVARAKIAHAFRNYKARGPPSSQLHSTGTVVVTAQSLSAQAFRCFF
jgi:hypothetical protein